MRAILPVITATRLYSHRRWLLIGGLEALYWAPPFLVPIIAKLAIGEHVWRSDVQSCVFMSMVLAFVGTYLGRWQGVYRMCLFPLLALGGLIMTGMALSKQGVLDPFVMLAIIDTDRGEAADFSKHYNAADAVLALLLLLPLAAIQAQRRWRAFLPRIQYAGTTLGALFAVQMGFRFHHYLVFEAAQNLPRSVAVERFWENGVEGYPLKYTPLQPYVSLAGAWQMHERLLHLRASAKPLEHVTAPAPPDGARRTYVVIVGEALSRRHMHLYGYPRDTTPKLDRLAANEDLLVFRDVVTSHAITVPALITAFSFAPGRGHDGHTLFDALNGAGFHTWWLSNQPQYSGLSEDGVALLTSGATQIWLNDPTLDAGEGDRRNFDSDVLAPLQQLFHKPQRDKFIFVHLMGNHDYYQSRYPPAAEYFTAPPDHRACVSQQQHKTINQYDNSVRFNDGVVSRIIDMVHEIGGESFVLYFSDHAEEVYDFRDYAGHSDAMMTPYNAEIPLVLWMSEEYRRNHRAFASHLSNDVGRPYDTGDLLYSISDLAHLSFPGMDPTRSLFSDRFIARTRLIAGKDFDRFVRSWQPDAAHAAPSPLIGCGLSVAAAEKMAAR